MLLALRENQSSLEVEIQSLYPKIQSFYFL
jgi:hypothetical protein